MIKSLVVGMMSTNAYIYAENNNCFIIDPGGNPDEIVQELKAEGCEPSAILCTHGHLDHIAGISGIYTYYKEQEGKELPIAIHELDEQFLGPDAETVHRSSFSAIGMLGADYFRSIFTNVPDPSIILHDGETVLSSRLRVIHTPGHTGGSICLYDAEGKILFSGDTLFRQSVGRTDLPGGNWEDLVTSIKEKLMGLPDDVSVYPGHGPQTRIEIERKGNPFIR